MKSQNSQLLKRAVVGLLSNLVQNEKQHLMRLAKLEATTCYIKTVDKVRLSVAALVGVTCCAMVLFLGLLLLHAALFISLPWGPWPRVILMAALGLVYVAVAVVVIVKSLSERRWMRCSGADRMLHEAVRPQQSATK